MRQLSLFLIGLLFLFSCADKAEKTKPTVGAMTESVYASLSIQPKDIYDVFPAIPGILEAVYIKEGDTVSKNQVLAQITAIDPKINAENAELNMKLARENFKGPATVLSNIEKEIASGRKQLKIDSLNYFRQKNLWEQNIGTQTELENRKLKYELAANNLDLLKKRYKQTKLELENSYKQSQNALKKARSNLGDYTIKARMDGRVYALRKEEGEIISQQEPLAQIGRTNSFVIEMMIDEVDVAKVKAGQPVFISLDAYEGQIFEATLTKIYPRKDPRTQTFKVEGEFKVAPKVLYAGLSGEANIVLSEKKNIMTIPLEYLLEGKKVLTQEGEVAVETGMKNLERIEIISGIDTATILHKP